MNSYLSPFLNSIEQTVLEFPQKSNVQAPFASTLSFLSQNFVKKEKAEHNELDVFREMLDRGHFCDVEIKVEKEKTLRAHGIILASKSNYFKSLFTGGFIESSNKTVDLSDINEDTMKSVLQYIYGKKLELNFQNVCSLLVLADRLLVDGLRRECVEFIQNGITEERVIDVWHFASKLNFTDLKKFCQCFILYNFGTINLNDSAQFHSLSGQDLHYFLRNDELRVSSEIDVLNCINKWANQLDFTGKNKYQDKWLCYLLLEGVRLSRLDKQKPFNGFPVLEMHINSCEFCKRHNNLLMMQTNIKTESQDFNFTTKEYRRSMIWHRPRAAHQILLAVGGWTGQFPTACVEIYNPQRDQWSILHWSDDIHRAYHGLVFLKNILYIVGGFDGAERLNTMHAFDRKTLKWQERAIMHDRRCYVCAVACGNFVYAIGGHNGIRRLKSAERYDPISNQWTYIQSMIEVRSDAHAVVLNELIYVVGGFDGDVIHSSVEVYHPSTDMWTFLMPMNNPRSGVKAAAFNGTIYALGGFDGQRRLKTVEYWNATDNCWVVEDAEMSIARSNFGVAVFDKFLAVIGGYDDELHQTTFQCEMYSAADRAWRPINNLPYREGISALSVVVVDGINNVNKFLKPLRSYSWNLS